MNPGTTDTESVFVYDDVYFRDPAAAHAKLRADGPVHRAKLPGGETAWLIVGHEQVRAALTDARLSLDKRHAAGGYTGLSLPPALERNLLSLEGPDHARLRRLGSPAFTAEAVASLAPRISGTAKRRLAELREAGQGDLIGQFAAPLTRDTLRHLLGVPDGQRDAFAAHVTTLTSAASEADEQRAAGGALLKLVGELVERKRREPADDLVSALVEARDGEDRLSEDEMLSLVFLLVMTGYETTAALIGSAALALLPPGAEVDAAADRSILDRSDVDRAIERALRENAPAPWSIRRFATTDLTFGDAAVHAGETVLLGLASANTDPLAQADPESARHLSFGHGAHYCLGAPLARLQAGLALSVLAAEPRLRIAADPAALVWRRSLRIRMLEALPVSWA